MHHHNNHTTGDVGLVLGGPGLLTRAHRQAGKLEVMQPFSHGLLRLPYDTLHKILKPLTEDYRKLRLVCTQLNDVVEPELLSCLAIYLSPNAAYQLEILATGRSRAASFARALNIYCVFLFKDPGAEARTKQYLGLAISSLVEVRSVRWIVNSPGTQWAEDTIFHAMTNLPLLQTLQLSMTNPSSSLHLSRLSGLKRIAITAISRDEHPVVLNTVADAIGQSPGLTHLELHPDSSEMAPSLREVMAKVPHSTPLQLTHLRLNNVLFRLDAFTIPHLRSLTFLDLSHFSLSQHWHQPQDSTGFLDRCAKHHSTLTDIFVTLACERIHLRGLIVHGLCNTAIVKYIGSYSDTLEHLEISHFSAENVESHALAEMFYTSAFPKHASVMRRLRILHDLNHEWNRNSQCMIAISQCRKLMSLEVALDHIGYANEDANNDRLDDVIVSLADPSLALAHLSVIHLHPAEDKAGAGRWCGTGRMQKNMRDYGAITRSIERFTLRLADHETHGHAALPDLALGSQLYKFEDVPGAGMPGTYKLSTGNLSRHQPFGSQEFKLPREG